MAIIVGLTVNGTPGSRDDIIFPVSVPGGPEIELPVITVRATWDSTPASSQWVLAYKPYGSQAQLIPGGPVPAKPDRAEFTMDVPGSYRVVNVIDGGTAPPQVASVIAASRIVMQPFSQSDPGYWNSLRIPAFAETTEFNKQPLSSQPNYCGWAREMEAWFYRIMRYGFGCVVWNIDAQVYTGPAYNLRFFADDTITEVVTQYEPLHGTATVRIPTGGGSISVWDGSIFTGPVEKLRITSDGVDGSLLFNPLTREATLDLPGGGGGGSNPLYVSKDALSYQGPVEMLCVTSNSSRDKLTYMSNTKTAILEIGGGGFTPREVEDEDELEEGDFAYYQGSSDITVYLP